MVKVLSLSKSDYRKSIEALSAKKELNQENL